MKALPAALLLSACVTAQSAPTQADGWSEIRTQHFRVRAQLDEGATAEIAQSLEGLRAGVAAYWGIDPTDRTEVVVYRDTQALNPFGGTSFVHQGANGTTLVTSAELAQAEAFARLAAHELAHLLGAHFMPRQPRWLSEGLAQYLETGDLTVSPGQVTFGKPPVGLRPNGLIAQPVTLAQLWEWTTDDTLPIAQTGWAWWVVHYLADAHAERFELWQRSVARGEEARPSFERAFAGLPAEKLEADMLAALTAGQLKFPAVVLSGGERPKPEASRPDPADLYALRAELLLLSSPLDFEVRRGAATAELEQALAIDARNADALVLKARLIPDPAVARTFAQRIVEALPQNPKAWGYLASILGREGDDPRQTLQFALALAPDHPGLLNTLAWYASYYGDKQLATKSAEKASALRPWSAAMVDTHAAVLGAAGRCPEAATRQRQALDLAVHAPAGQREAYLARLRTYETTCTRQTPTALAR